MREPQWEDSVEALDPEVRNPGYWSRFRHRTLALCGAELERRRRAAETVSGTVSSWARTIVPAAVAVAAVAVLLILAEPASAPAPSAAAGPEAVEAALDEDPIPALLSEDGPAVAVTMVGEAF